jgi:hypothetical protein
MTIADDKLGLPVLRAGRIAWHDLTQPLNELVSSNCYVQGGVDAILVDAKANVVQFRLRGAWEVAAFRVQQY